MGWSLIYFCESQILSAQKYHRKMLKPYFCKEVIKASNMIGLRITSNVTFNPTRSIVRIDFMKTKNELNNKFVWWHPPNKNSDKNLTQWQFGRITSWRRGYKINIKAQLLSSRLKFSFGQKEDWMGPHQVVTGSGRRMEFGGNGWKLVR